jgi:hypothetical protein
MTHASIFAAFNEPFKAGIEGRPQSTKNVCGENQGSSKLRA